MTATERRLIRLIRLFYRLLCALLANQAWGDALLDMKAEMEKEFRSELKGLT